MTTSRATLVIFLAMCVLALHLLGIFLRLYWRLNWYDHVVHTTAGATATLALFSIGTFARLVRRPLIFFTCVILISLAIGTLWEFFELEAGVTVWSAPGYVLDTTGDMISDVVGGFLAGGYLLL